MSRPGRAAPLAALALLATGCHGLLYAPRVPGAHGERTTHYLVKTDRGPEEARALGAECERMLAAYLRLLPPEDPEGFCGRVSVRPFAVIAIRDAARFRDASERHGAAAIDGFFCEDGGECVVGPGLAGRVESEPTAGAEVRSFPGALERARASDLHVLYHEGFHQYLARLGARDVPPWLAEGLAEHFARRAAELPGQRFAAERRAAGRRDLALAARDLLAARESPILATDDLSRVALRDLGISLEAYRTYALFATFLLEGEGGRLAPRLLDALARRRGEIDLRGVLEDRAGLERALRSFAERVLAGC